MRAAVEQAKRWCVQLAEMGAAAATWYHRAELRGREHLPRTSALLVGNHGLFGYETPVFFYLLWRTSGRRPVGLADHGFFRIPVVRTVLPWVGGIDGTRQNAIRALKEGKHVVCYPGGAREVFKRRSERYRLRWERSTGFVKVAAQVRAPIVPFAGHGIDDAFIATDDPRLAVPLSTDERYRVPLAIGAGPLPRRVRFRFALAAPLEPPRSLRDPVLRSFQKTVAQRVRALLAEIADA